MKPNYLALSDDEQAHLIQLGQLLRPHLGPLAAGIADLYAAYSELDGLTFPKGRDATIRADMVRWVEALATGDFATFFSGTSEEIRQRAAEEGALEALAAVVLGRQRLIAQLLRDDVGCDDATVAAYERALQKIGLLRLTKAQHAYQADREAAIHAQQALVLALSTPVIEVWQGILVLPLVGTIGTQRARQITQGLLSAIRDHQARTVILDISGVPVVDTQVANHLLKSLRAARLLGARGILVGISPEIADTLVTLDVDLDEVETYVSLRRGLAAAIAHLGGTVNQLDA